MTFRSKIIWLIAALVVLTGAPVMAQDDAAAAPKYSAERMALAKQYVATLGLESDIKAAVDSMANRVAPENRVLFRRLGESGVDYNRLRAAAELVVLDVFTDSEIEALTQFYSTPEGQSIRKKMPQFDQRMQPVINEAMVGFVKKLQENQIVPAN